MSLTNASPRRKRKRKTQPISQETKDEILALHKLRYGTRRIRERVGHSRKVVRRVLTEAGLSPDAPQAPPSASKLQPFHEPIVERVKKGLTVTRILREIRQLGYRGGRTILSTYVRPLRVQLGLEARKMVKRRFETLPGQEMQIDWSPYRISIGGQPTLVHAFGCLLCASRKLYLRFFRDERQSTLFEALAGAFVYFAGCALRVVLDNMSTCVLGRIGPDRTVLWHPRFLVLAAHYGFEPFACAVRDPDRKGKKEKSFRLVWDDFLKGTDFASWDDLHEKCRLWLDHTPGVGNLRLHGTTRLVPNEAFQAEKQHLIRLPEHPFPVYEESVREVDADSTLSIQGTRFTVPGSLANRAVAVRLFAEHFEVLHPHGQVAFSRRYAEAKDHGKLITDKLHYENLPRGRRARAPGERLDEAFLRRFPDLAPLVEGLQRRMKGLAPVHLRALLRLADRYGQDAFAQAARRVQDFRRFSALAVQRILENDHPLADGDLVPPLGGIGPLVLGEVETPSLDGYGDLDHRAPSSTHKPKE